MEPSFVFNDIFASPAKLYYDYRDLFLAWYSLLHTKIDFTSVDTYRYDLVDLTWLCLSNYAVHIHENIATAFNASDIPSYKKHTQQFIDVLSDVDTILNTHPFFMLGKWTELAKMWGNTTLEVQKMSIDARTMITTWGPPGDLLNMYAYKIWGGLVKDVFVPKWQIFFENGLRALEIQEPFDEKKNKQEQLKFITGWIHASNVYPRTSRGDTVAVSNALFNKYGN
jgi:alpha-N-acetylglucosaminidase